LLYCSGTSGTCTFKRPGSTRAPTLGPLFFAAQLRGSSRGLETERSRGRLRRRALVELPGQGWREEQGGGRSGFGAIENEARRRRKRASSSSIEPKKATNPAGKGSRPRTGEIVNAGRLGGLQRRGFWRELASVDLLRSQCSARASRCSSSRRRWAGLGPRPAPRVVSCSPVAPLRRRAPVVSAPGLFAARRRALGRRAGQAPGTASVVVPEAIPSDPSCCCPDVSSRPRGGAGVGHRAGGGMAESVGSRRIRTKFERVSCLGSIDEGHPRARGGGPHGRPRGG